MFGTNDDYYDELCIIVYVCVLRMQQVAKVNIVMLITYTHVHIGTVYNNHEISNYVYMCCVLIAFFLTLTD